VAGSAEIKAVVKSNLELQKIRPNLDPLKELLRQELFDLELDEETDRSKYERSTEALFNKLQSSKAELLAGLTRLEAVQHRGQWWLLHPRTTEVLLREILNIRLQFKYVSRVTHTELHSHHVTAGHLARYPWRHCCHIFPLIFRVTLPNMLCNYLLPVTTTRAPST